MWLPAIDSRQPERIRSTPGPARGSGVPRERHSASSESGRAGAAHRRPKRPRALVSSVTHVRGPLAARAAAAADVAADGERYSSSLRKLTVFKEKQKARSKRDAHRADWFEEARVLRRSHDELTRAVLDCLASLVSGGGGRRAAPSPGRATADAASPGEARDDADEATLLVARIAREDGEGSERLASTRAAVGRRLNELKQLLTLVTRQRPREPPAADENTPNPPSRAPRLERSEDDCGADAGEREREDQPEAATRARGADAPALLAQLLVQARDAHEQSTRRLANEERDAAAGALDARRAVSAILREDVSRGAQLDGSAEAGALDDELHVLLTGRLREGASDEALAADEARRARVDARRAGSLSPSCLARLSARGLRRSQEWPEVLLVRADLCERWGALCERWRQRSEASRKAFEDAFVVDVSGGGGGGGGSCPVWWHARTGGWPEEHHLIFESTLAAARGRDRATVIERLELALSSVTRDGEERDGEDARAYSRSELVIHWVWCEARDAARVRRRAHADDAARERAEFVATAKQMLQEADESAVAASARAAEAAELESHRARLHEALQGLRAERDVRHADAERAADAAARAAAAAQAERDAEAAEHYAQAKRAIEAYHEKVRRARRAASFARRPLSPLSLSPSFARFLMRRRRARSASAKPPRRSRGSKPSARPRSAPRPRSRRRTPRASTSGDSSVTRAKSRST